MWILPFDVKYPEKRTNIKTSLIAGIFNIKIGLYKIKSSINDLEQIK